MSKQGTQLPSTTQQIPFWPLIVPMGLTLSERRMKPTPRNSDVKNCEGTRGNQLAWHLRQKEMSQRRQPRKQRLSSLHMQTFVVKVLAQCLQGQGLETKLPGNQLILRTRSIPIAQHQEWTMQNQIVRRI